MKTISNFLERTHTLYITIMQHNSKEINLKIKVMSPKVCNKQT